MEAVVGGDWMWVQLVALSLLATVLLVAWGDLGGLAVARRLSSGVRFLVGLVAIAGMIGAVVAPTYFAPLRPGGLVEGGPPPNAGPPRKSAPLNLDWALVNVSNGTPVNLETFRGKVLFINIWATWCKPCVNEMPSIERLYESFAGRDDVAFLLISQDDDAAKAAKFAKSRGLKVPVYHGGPAPSQFQTEGIPATVIVRKDGTLHFADVGARDWGTSAWVKELEQLTGPQAQGAAKEPKP